MALGVVPEEPTEERAGVVGTGDEVVPARVLL